MGFAVGSRCFTEESAALAFFYSETPVDVASGNPPTWSRVEYDGAWHLRTYEGVVQMSDVLLGNPGFASCSQVEAVGDGALLGFAVVGVWVIAWGFKVMQRVF